MKVKWLMLVCFLVAVFMAVGCAPTKAPKVEVPAEYRSIRMLGGSIGSESNTAVMTFCAILNKYYPEIEWSSCSGASVTNLIYINKGAVKIGVSPRSGYIDAYGFDKIAESRIRSINLPRAAAHYFFIIPEDKPWKDIAEVPKGAVLCPGTPGSVQPMLVEAWLKVCGLDKRDFKWTPLGKSELADAWRAGKLDVALITVSGVAPYLMDLHTGPRKFRPMGLSPEQAARVKAEPAFERSGFDPPSQSILTQLAPEVFKYDIVCPAVPNFLNCRDDFAEEIAYKMAKVIDEHHADLVQICPPMKLGATPQHHIRWAKPPLDIHPGVAKYYREKGYLK